jgi:putative transcriptional regulator
MTSLYVLDEGIETKKYEIARIDIKKVMQKKGISIYELSRRTGLKYDTVKKYYYQKIYQVDLDVLAKICYVLKCNFFDIVEIEKK